MGAHLLFVILHYAKDAVIRFLNLLGIIILSLYIEPSARAQIYECSDIQVGVCQPPPVTAPMSNDDLSVFTENVCVFAPRSSEHHPGYQSNNIIRFERGIRFPSGEHHRIVVANGRTGSLRLRGVAGNTETRMSRTFQQTALPILDLCARRSANNYFQSISRGGHSIPNNGWIRRPIRLDHKGTYSHRRIRGSASAGAEDERSLSLHTLGRAIDVDEFRIENETFNYRRDLAATRASGSSDPSTSSKWNLFWTPFISCIDGQGLASVNHNDRNYDHLHI